MGVTNEVGTDAWNRDAVESLIGQLSALRAGMVAFETGLTPRLRSIEPCFAPSARNLAHYLALRRTDIRALQDRLAWVGVSSLGRAETHVLANLDKVLGILHRLIGRPWTTADARCSSDTPPTCSVRRRPSAPCGSW